MKDKNQKNNEQKSYPAVTSFFSIVLTSLYTAFLLVIYEGKWLLSLWSIVLLGAYLWIIFRAKKQYLSGEIKEGLPWFLALAGPLLLFFGNFAFCVFGAMR